MDVVCFWSQVIFHHPVNRSSGFIEHIFHLLHDFSRIVAKFLADDVHESFNLNIALSSRALLSQDTTVLIKKFEHIKHSFRGDTSLF